MIFLSLIVVLLLVQWWGSGAPLQHDAWFVRWSDFLQSRRFLSPAVHLVLAIFVPAVLLGLLVWLIVHFLSVSWLFFIYVPVLLYSLGRGNFSAEVKTYLSVSARGDNVLASKLTDELRGGAEPEREPVEVDDWAKLHAQTLRIISYRGFERMFAVLFWFFVFGAVGALVYRLSVIYRERSNTGAHAKLAAKWLWLMEWPAVRVMGLTWAMVGNFETCYRCWQSRLLDVTHSSMTQLSASLYGALGVDDALIKAEVGGHISEPIDIPRLTPSEPAYSLSLVRNSLSLFSRSLLLWVCVVALVTLII